MKNCGAKCDAKIGAKPIYLWLRNNTFYSTIVVFYAYQKNSPAPSIRTGEILILFTFHTFQQTVQ